jgi:hypothetical protein
VQSSGGVYNCNVCAPFSPSAPALATAADIPTAVVALVVATAANHHVTPRSWSAEPFGEKAQRARRHAS